MAVIASLGGITVGTIPSRAVRNPKRHPSEILVAQLLMLPITEQESLIHTKAYRDVLSAKSYHNQCMRIVRELAEFDRAISDSTQCERERLKREDELAKKAGDPAIGELKRPCFCRKCLNRNEKPFPAYYVRYMLAFECHLERQQEDRERMAKEDQSLVEELLALECSNNRSGARIVRIRDYA